MNKNKRILLRRMKTVLGICLAAGCLLGGSVTARAEGTVINRTSREIYHQHTGNETESGGCYKEPVYHTHTGNEEEGGACYAAPVFHKHQGNTQKGGACYKTPILHVHSGDTQNGGACYKAVVHTHNDSCYRAVPSAEYGCYVVNWWDTIDGDDGINDFKYYEVSCGQTIHGTNPAHFHMELNCSREGDVIGYTMNCMKQEGTTDGWKLDCGKIAGTTIDSYALSCEKTETDIDSYIRNCGLDETTPAAILRVTELRDGQTKRTLQAEIEDRSGGRFPFLEEDFLWLDAEGNRLGTGMQITVGQNGHYYLEAAVDSIGVRAEDLRIGIEVSDIVYPTPEPEPEPEPDTDNGGSGGQGGNNGNNGSYGNNGNDSGENNGNNDGDTGGNSGGYEDEDGDSSGGNDSDNDGENDGDEDGSRVDGSHEDGGPGKGTAKGMSKSGAEKAAVQPTSVKERLSAAAGEKSSGKPATGYTPENVPAEIPEAPDTDGTEGKTEDAGEKPGLEEFDRERIQKTLPENLSSGKDKLEPKSLDAPKGIVGKILANPVARVISITFGSLLGLSGLCLLLYLLRMSVAVYNDDGTGGLTYLGRSRIRWTQDGFLVVISRHMEDRSVTNRYVIRPGFFRYFQKEEELLVQKGDKVLSVLLDKEMVIVL